MILKFRPPDLFWYKFIKNKIVIASTVLLLFSCSPIKIIKPLEKSEKQVSLHLGGPLIEFGSAIIPIPFSSLTYSKGFTEKSTGFGSLQVTSLLYGNFHSELGVLRGFNQPEKLLPGITVGGIINFITNGTYTRLYPQIDFNMYWDFKEHHTFYTGLMSWFDLSRIKAHGEKQEQHWIPAFSSGYLLQKGKWSYQIEMKWIAFFNSNYSNAVTYVGMGERGALGFYLGFSRTFGH